MDSLRNIFAIPELRKRVLFTFAILAVYRIGGHINTPGINIQALSELTRQAASSNLFGLYDMFSGYNLSQMTVFALGVMPYISASIILQLLTVVWPYLERLSKEGEIGRRKITQYTRYGTIVLSVVQALAMAGHEREARANFESMLARFGADRVGPYRLAIAHTRLGDADRAFAALERAGALCDMNLVCLAVDPSFDALRDHPRWKGTLARFNLPDLDTRVA